jgi:uncharacterized membrane protein
MRPRALPGLDQAERVAAELEHRDPYWPAQVTLVAAILLSLNLPSKLTLNPYWLLPALEGALLVALIGTTPWDPLRAHPARRLGALILIAIVSGANLLSLVLLAHYLVGSSGHAGGHQLILAGGEIWITNVLIFAIWYWEFDRGGPQGRRLAEMPRPDFLFPQYTEDYLGRWSWRPRYVDYLYTSFTNATAFSPTDTMPLSAWAKMAMLVQSLASLVTLGLVVARAVNIL